MLMNRVGVAVCSVLLSVPLVAAPVLDLKLAANEWISAAEIADDASGTIVIAQTQPRATRLVRFRGSEVLSATPVPGFAINHFEALPAAGGRFLAGGSVDAANGGAYVYRLMDWRGGAPSVLWDSRQLPARALDDDPYIRMSPDARLWGTVSQRGGVLRFTWGEVDAPAPRATITIESENVERPDGFVFDGADLVFVRSKGASPMVAVLWSGRVYVLDLAAGSVTAVLAPPLGGSTLLFDRGKDVLWVGGNEWAGFSIDEVLRNARRERAHVPSQRKSRDVATPLNGGISVSNVATRALVRVSPGGDAVLIGHEGPMGSTLEIRRIK